MDLLLRARAPNHAILSHMNRTCRRGLLAASIGTVLALPGCENISENDVDKVRINPVTLSDWIRKDPQAYLLLDARQKNAFDAERIPGSERLDPQTVDPEDPDPKFGRYKAVIVYGQDPSFGRANVLTKRLLEAGTDVYMLDGGLMAWKSRGLPVIGVPQAMPDPSAQPAAQPPTTMPSRPMSNQ